MRSSQLGQPFGAFADHPAGPYKPAGVVLPARGEEFWNGDCTHNPTIHQFDGKYYLYYMSTVAKEDDMPRKLSWPHRATTSGSASPSLSRLPDRGSDFRNRSSTSRRTTTP